MNALNGEIQHGLIAACREAAERRDVAAVIVYGGEKVFAAGADIKEMEAMSYTDMVDHSARCRTSPGRWRASPSRPSPPSPATPSAAGARSRSRATSASPPTNAKLGQPEILLGIIPGAGGTQRLARLVGPAKAKDLVFSGRFVGADEALAIGLVDEVVDPRPTSMPRRGPGCAATSAARPTRCARPRRPSTAASRSTSTAGWRSSGCCSPALSPRRTARSA